MSFLRLFKLPDSLHFRLLAGAGVWVALALVAVGFVLADLFADHARRRLDDTLLADLDQLAASLTVEARQSVRVTRPLSDPRFMRPLSGLYWQVQILGALPLRSRSLWDNEIRLPSDDLRGGDLHRHLLPGPANGRLIVLERQVVLEDGGLPVRIAVAVDDIELVRAIRDFNRTLALSLGLLGLGLVGAAVVQVKVGLAPLVRLRRHLADVREGRTRRLPADMPREIRPLVDDMNAVLDHDDAVVARARLQAGNLAHALKTDLAVLANDAAAAGAAETPEAACRMAAAVARMTRHIDHHMARARAAGSAGVPGVRTSVIATAEPLIRTLSRLYQDKGLRFDLRVSPGLRFAGDEQDLTEMLGNLLDNACKWGVAAVVVTAGTADGLLTVVVEDDGPGLPETARETVLRSGVRLDESVPGSGLGLAVVVDLAQLYGGSLTLETAAAGGLSARLRLPAA